MQSCNRSCRLLEARDGWIALSLPRPSDIEMLPAWLGIEVDADPWQAAGQRVKRFDRAELTAMAEGLPLAFAVLPETAEPVAPAAATAAAHRHALLPRRSRWRCTSAFAVGDRSVRALGGAAVRAAAAPGGRASHQGGKCGTP